MVKDRIELLINISNTIIDNLIIAPCHDFFWGQLATDPSQCLLT